MRRESENRECRRRRKGGERRGRRHDQYGHTGDEQACRGHKPLPPHHWGVTPSSRLARSHRAARRVCRAAKSVWAHAHIVKLRRLSGVRRTRAPAPRPAAPAPAGRTVATLHGRAHRSNTARSPAGAPRSAPTARGASAHFPLVSSLPRSAPAPPCCPSATAPSATVRMAEQTGNENAALARCAAARRGHRLSGDAWGFSKLPPPLAPSLAPRPCVRL
jgi:hypothetical protein